MIAVIASIAEKVNEGRGDLRLTRLIRTASVATIAAIYDR